MTGANAYHDLRIAPSPDSNYVHRLKGANAFESLKRILLADPLDDPAVALSRALEISLRLNASDVAIVLRNRFVDFVRAATTTPQKRGDLVAALQCSAGLTDLGPLLDLVA